MAQPLRKVLSNAWQKPGPMLRYVSDGVADTEHAMGDGSSGTGETWYDQQGNLLTQKTAGGNQETFTWNNRNLLTQVVTKNSSGTVTQTVNYTYNAANQRISKIVTNGSGVVVTNQRYVYDGNNLLAVLNVDPTTGTPTVAQRFLTQESGVGSQETGTLAQENASSTGQAGPVLWAITDNTGSVVDVVNNGSGNAIINHIVYDSFGNTVSQTNSADAMLMGFDGYVYDAETGLYYANARYYSPTLGRFISQDPSGFSAGDSNLYRFVGNHPTYATDPTGLYEGGSAFTQGMGSYGGSSLIAPWLNLGGGSSGSASTGSSPVSLTAPTSAFGGNGPISAPTSTGGSSGFGGSGSYGSGSNSIAFNLGGGGSNQGLSSLASSVYAPMGGGPTPGFSNIPTAASSAAYMQNLEAQYPAMIHAGVDQGISGLIQGTQTWNPASSILGSLGGEFSSWGQSEASGGNTALGTAGMFLGGVANTAAGISNPVGSLLSLSGASYNVAYRDGALAGVGYGVGSLIGATQAAQAYYATNFATGQSLYGLNRIGMGFSALSAASGAAAGAAAGFQTAFVTPDALAASASRTVSLNVLNSEFTPNAATTAARIEGVAQDAYNYAVSNPSAEGLSRVRLGREAEIQATRTLRRWAQRNGIQLGDGGLRFQAAGDNSTPDIVYDPAMRVLDFKLSPAAIRPSQTASILSDFPGYDLKYVLGPDTWR